MEQRWNLVLLSQLSSLTFQFRLVTMKREFLLQKPENSHNFSLAGSTISIEGVLSDTFVYRTYGRIVKIKNVLSEILKVKSKASPGVFTELERLLRRLEAFFQQGNADIGKSKVPQLKKRLRVMTIIWEEGLV